jgi:hypothetical protein
MTGIITTLGEMKKFTSRNDPYYATIKDLVEVSTVALGNMRDANEEINLIMRKIEPEDPLYDGLQYVRDMINHSIGRMGDDIS